jgi:hypothetical protein
LAQLTVVDVPLIPDADAHAEPLQAQFVAVLQAVCDCSLHVTQVEVEPTQPQPGICAQVDSDDTVLHAAVETPV